MKIIRNGSILAFILLVIIMAGCSKRATKEQAIEQRMKLIAWYESEDFKKIVLAHINDDGTLKDQAVFEKTLKDAENKKIDEIVKAMGFENQEAFKAVEEVLNSKEVKEADKKLADAAVAAMTKVITDKVTQKMADESKKLENPN